MVTILITISIITATFNAVTKLERTIKSTEHWKNHLEHIVIDGQSTDGTVLLLESIQSRYAHLRFTSEPDQGIYHALNKGISAARGDYIIFLGAGDELLPSSIDLLLPYLANNSSLFIYGDIIKNGERYGGMFDLNRLHYENICHQAIAYNRKLFPIVGLYDLRFRIFADWDFNLRCFKSHLTAPKYVPVAISFFEEGGISSSRGKLVERELSLIYSKNFGQMAYIWRQTNGMICFLRVQLGLLRQTFLKQIRRL